MSFFTHGSILFSMQPTRDWQFCQFKDFEEYLLPVDAIQKMKQTASLPLAVNPDCEAYLTERLAALENQLAAVNRLAAGNGLPEAILTDSGLKITPLDASEPPAAKDFIERTAALLPHIKITELLQEVDKWTGFTRHFKHLKTGEPAKDKLLLLSVILADGINIGLTKMAESCPGTTYAKLAWLECFRSQFCRALISLRLTSSTQPRR